MFKKLIAIGTLISALMFATTVEAQSRVVVRRNGKIVIAVTLNRQRYETPRLHRVPPRHYRYRRPQFRNWRHINRFYYQKGHASHRCGYCIRYDRWRMWRPRRYDPVIHVRR